MDRPHLDQARLFFLILKPVTFKKLNGIGRGGLMGMGKFSNPVSFTFDFCLYILFLIFLFILY